MDNNNSEYKEIQDLIRQLGKGVRKHGIKKVVRALKEISILSEDDEKSVIIEFIETSVCAKLGLPIEELFSFKSRGEVTIARKLCILLTRNNIKKPTNKNKNGISDDELANHYNRTRQVVHTTEKEYEALMNGKKNQFHIDFLSIYNELDVEVKKFIKTLKHYK